MDKELNGSYAIHEIPVNGWLYYCSGKKKESSNRETSLVISVGIGKSAIEGYLIFSKKGVLQEYPLTSYIIDSINIIKSEGQSLKSDSGAAFSRRPNKVTQRKVNEGGSDMAVERIIDYDIGAGVYDFRTCMAMFV